MLVKNDLNMNNNGKNEEYMYTTSQANKIIKFISTNIKA